ncbi:thioredoxin [Patescibacteria group bacterium]|nr:thioredoxin [Patescibacteria group bacterium]
MADLTFTDQNFKEEVLDSKIPVLVDFWASWCGPCKTQGPIIDKLATEFEGKEIKIGKMNVEENNKTPSQYQVMSIPTLIIFKEGKPTDVISGVTEIDILKNKIDALLK